MNVTAPKLHKRESLFWAAGFYLGWTAQATKVQPSMPLWQIAPPASQR
jgi:hypothetical protein